MAKFGVIIGKKEKSRELFDKYRGDSEIIFLNKNSDDINEEKLQQNKYKSPYTNPLLNIDKNENLDAIIVAGGDGQMLRALHQYYKLNIPFIGINAGSLGFLMNDKIDNDFETHLKSSETVELNPLYMKAIDSTGKMHEKIAFNDIYLHRLTNQASKLAIKVNNQLEMNELVADGVIVSSPAGSSAYNFSAGGRVVPLDSRVICVTPVCPFRPRRWHGAIIPNTSEISVEVIDPKWRPVYAVADFNEINNIHKIEVREEHNISVKLLFSSNQGLNHRMIKEQFSI